jgi:PucR family transcriptional regulator, purine catabolism regulatory protein
MTNGAMTNSGASVPVRWLVAQPALGLAVLAGSDGLNRAVTWAHSIELTDPAPWLRGGELLLTTGLRLPVDPDGQRRYVRSVAAAGVAAIGFGVGLSHRSVPPAVVATAEELGLPLLEVPLPTPFVAVVRAVTERLAELQYEGVVRASRVQPRMTRAAARGGPAGVLRELAAALDGHAALLARDATVLAATDREAGAAAAAVFGELGIEPESDRVASSASVRPGGVVSAQTIRIGRRVHGYLVLTTPAGLAPGDHLLLGHAASLIALEREKPLRLRHEQSRVNAMVLDLLLDGALAAAPAAQQLASAGLRTDAGLVVLVADGLLGEAGLQPVDDVLREDGVPLVAAVRDGAAVIVLPSAVADAVLATCPVRTDAGPVHIGRATTAAVDGVVEAERCARAAARAARAQGRRIVDAATLGGSVLTAEPATRAVLGRLAETMVRPLAEHDERTGSRLVDTMHAFLEHHGQVEAAAAALGIHRHTMRARMDRVRSLLAVDLDSAHVRAELLLALTSWMRETT